MEKSIKAVSISFPAGRELSMATLASLKKTVSVFTRTLAYLERSKHPYSDIDSLKLNWAKDSLESMGVQPIVKGNPCQDGPLILVGNHISYLDIPLLMFCSPGVTFLAKHQISRWPIVGRGATLIGTTFVNRECRSDRAAVRITISEVLKTGAKMVLFPSGTTCVEEAKPWRKGAFEMACEHNIPVQPFRIRYEPLRSAAYIDRDIFPLQLFRLAQAGHTQALIEFHPPVHIDDPLNSAARWRNWVRDGASLHGVATNPRPLTSSSSRQEL